MRGHQDICNNRATDFHSSQPADNGTSELEPQATAPIPVHGAEANYEIVNDERVVLVAFVVHGDTPADNA